MYTSLPKENWLMSGASGAGGVWMSTKVAYPNIVWQVQWPEEITKDVVSDNNPKGKIINSYMEMEAVLLQWLVREDNSLINHETILGCSDNAPACSWATIMLPKSNVDQPFNDAYSKLVHL